MSSSLIKYLKPYRKECVLAPLFKLLEALLELFVPLVIANIIDVGIANKDGSYILRMCLLLIFIAFVGLSVSITAQYFSAKATRIFERTGEEYKFLQSDEGKLNSIRSQNLENKLFLATATTWNYDKTKEPYLWFAKNIDTYSGGMLLNDFIVNAKYALRRYGYSIEMPNKRGEFFVIERRDAKTQSNYFREDKNLRSFTLLRSCLLKK